MTVTGLRSAPATEYFAVKVAELNKQCRLVQQPASMSRYCLLPRSNEVLSECLFVGYMGEGIAPYAGSANVDIEEFPLEMNNLCLQRAATDSKNSCQRLSRRLKGSRWILGQAVGRLLKEVPNSVAVDGSPCRPQFIIEKPFLFGSNPGKPGLAHPLLNGAVPFYTDVIKLLDGGSIFQRPYPFWETHDRARWQCSLTVGEPPHESIDLTTTAGLLVELAGQTRSISF